MNETAYLLCEVVEKIEDTGVLYKLRSYLHDGTPFELTVDESLVEIISKGPPISAWLVVESSGERDGRVSITLPRPILSMGHKISVPIDKISRNIKHK